MTLAGRDFLKESDFTADELDHLLRLAADLKIAKRSGSEVKRLVGKQLALIFEKTSTRTKVSFEIAMRDQGGHVSVLDPSTSQIGHKESVADTARVLAELFDGIEYRGADHANLEELAQYSSVPVFNGLTDDWHPTQMLADFMTMREHAAGAEISYAYVGDARYNMGNSLLVMGAIMGADVRIVAPRSLWPSEAVQSLARERASSSGARIIITDDAEAGVKGAQFIHTDIWVSMGEPAAVWAERVALLAPYRVDGALMSLTGRDDARFMHCLPAYHDQKTTVGRRIAEEFGLVDGVEVSGEVFESPASIVFEQAQNRMHSIKAVLVATLANN